MLLSFFLALSGAHLQQAPGVWDFAREATSCRTSYAAGRDSFAFEATPRTGVRLVAKLPDWAEFEAGSVTLTVSASTPAPVEDTRSVFAQRADAGTPGFRIDASDLSMVAGGDSVVFTDLRSGRKSQPLSVSSFLAAKRRVERCLFEMLQTDPGSGAPAVAPPQLLSMPVTADDYPSTALRNAVEGTVAVSLVVSAAGRVSRCDVVQAVGWMDLDEQTCWLFAKRALFAPAKDAEGKATQGIFQKSFAWRIGKF